MNWKEFFKPNILKIIIILLLALSAYGVWYWGMNPGCCDMPRHIQFIPVIHPPFIFDEACTGTFDNPQVRMIFAYECNPSFLDGPDGPIYCTASCKINPLSYLIAIVYWYLLSCILAFTYYKVKENKKKPLIKILFKIIIPLILFLYLLFIVLRATGYSKYNIFYYTVIILIFLIIILAIIKYFKRKK